MQKLMCTGRITQDLELRYSNENKPVLYIPIAVINSNKEAKPLYLNFLVYGDVAKVHAQYLTKGSTIGIEGHIYQVTKEENGIKKRYDNYYADKIEYLNIKREIVNQVTSQQQATDVQIEQAVNTMVKEEEDPFKAFGEEIQLSDEDLPF